MSDFVDRFRDYQRTAYKIQQAGTADSNTGVAVAACPVPNCSERFNTSESFKQHILNQHGEYADGLKDVRIESLYKQATDS
jgi:hypothetical protein